MTDRYLQRCMNKVNITYRNLLFENGLNIKKICENYKKQFNILIQENKSCTKFVKSNCANQPEKKIVQKKHKELSNTQIIDRPNTRYQLKLHVAS